MGRLLNAPLQEVIFEVRWRLQPVKDTGQFQDIGFELASGRLNALLESEFPFYRRILPSELPDQLLSYKVAHQYWKAENTWPVIQLGPGIFTVNCTDQVYDWDTVYRPLIEKAINWLMQAYREPLQLALASLRYIDSIKVDDYGGVTDGWQSFIKNNFNIEYINSFNTRGLQSRIQIDQSFDMEDGSELQVQMSNGTRHNDPAIVWQTAILKKQSFTKEEVLIWSDKAHTISHELFYEMIKPDLYASFNRKNENKN